MLSIFKIFNNVFTSNQETYLGLALPVSWELKVWFCQLLGHYKIPFLMLNFAFQVLNELRIWIHVEAATDFLENPKLN